MLYRSPTARVRTNDILSPQFALGRGTRQGYPFSPGLFALAKVPLAILLHSSPHVPGLSVGPLQEIISLYADDALLYQPDASASLHVALAIVDRFGVFSGIKINWSKSLIFPFSLHPPLPPPPHPHCPGSPNFTT